MTTKTTDNVAGGRRGDRQTVSDVSANNVLDYLRTREWSMGCLGGRNMGQCPECCGVHESWLGHPLHLDSSELGHKKGCSLAAAIESCGGVVVYVGESQLTERYEDYIDERGFFSTRLVGEQS